jgi:hypothetical protein
MKGMDDVRMNKHIESCNFDSTRHNNKCNGTGRTYKLCTFPRMWQGTKLAIQEQPQGLIGSMGTAVLSTHMITINLEILLSSSNIPSNKDFILLQ